MFAESRCISVTLPQRGQPRLTATSVSNYTMASPNPPHARINSLFPHELLTSVFTFLYHCRVTPFPFLPFPPELDRCHPLLNLMLVCRAWYELIRGTQAFWTSITVVARVSAGRAAEGTGSTGAAGGAIWLREYLTRSGQLPIDVTIAAYSALDFKPVVQTLHEHAHRLDALSAIRWDEGNWYSGLYRNPIEELLHCPFPTLKHLFIGPCPTSFSWRTASQSRINTESPQLRTLACSYHLIIPSQPSLLTHLALDWVDLDAIRPPLEESTIELPHLLELCLKDCHPTVILSTLSAPALQKLAVRQTTSSHLSPREIPSYLNLREIQWQDVLPDPALRVVLRSCPNLTSFANYIVGDEPDIDINMLNTPPSILDTLGGETQEMEEEELGRWPFLKEILLDFATCEEVSKLVEIVPSIQRVCLLETPTKKGDAKNQEREEKLLSNLRQRLDVVIRNY